MRIAPNAKCQRVLVLAVWLVVRAHTQTHTHANTNVGSINTDCCKLGQSSLMQYRYSSEMCRYWRRSEYWPELSARCPFTKCQALEQARTRLVGDFPAMAGVSDLII